MTSYHRRWLDAQFRFDVPSLTPAPSCMSTEVNGQNRDLGSSISIKKKVILYLLNYICCAKLNFNFFPNRQLEALNSVCTICLGGGSFGLKK